MRNVERKSNIELLRIIFSMGVTYLHLYNRIMGGGLNYFTEYNINFYLSHFIVTFFVMSVNLYMLICGFFNYKNEKINLLKLISILFEVIFINLLLYMTRCVLYPELFSFKYLLYNLFPHNYFVIFYCIIIVLSKYINPLFKYLKRKDLITFVILLFIVFSLHNWIIDALDMFFGMGETNLNSIGIYSSQQGYTVVNFLLMYIIGATINYFSLFNKIKTNNALFLFIILVLILSFVSSLNIGKYSVTEFEELVWEYSNPFMIIASCLIFILFYRYNFSCKIVNNLSKAAFTNILLGTTFFHFFDIKSIFSLKLMLIPTVLIVGVVIYLMSYVFYFIWKNSIERFLNYIYIDVFRFKVKI